MVKIKNLNIGIISLGWLGESTADFLAKTGAKVWGTVSSEVKAARINEKKAADGLVWRNEIGLSAELKEKISTSDVLILNLPPNVFGQESYREGLLQFIPYSSDKTKVIFTSSTSVYPAHVKDAVETYEISEAESTTISEAENGLRKLLGNRLCILRLAGLIGEDRHPVHYLAKKETNLQPHAPVNLIHRNDVMRVIELVIQRDFFNETWNVCHPNHPTRQVYYSNKAAELNLPKLNFVEDLLLDAGKVVNCEKLIKKMGYTKFMEL